MLARIFSCAVIGLEGVVIEVEVDTSGGLPKMIIVGLPDAAVQESRERVQFAIRNSGLFYPRKKFTVNLAPAAVRKEGPAFDLPIALGVLVTTAQIPQQALEETMAIGELSLDGSVRHVRGILPMAAIARDEGFKHIFVPEEDAHHVPIQGHGRKIPHQVLEEIGYFDSRKRFPLSYPIKVREDQFLGYACGREGDTGL